MFQIGVCFFQVPVGLYAVEWSTGKGPELAVNYWMKRHWKALNFLGLLAQEPCPGSNHTKYSNNRIIPNPDPENN